MLETHHTAHADCLETIGLHQPYRTAVYHTPGMHLGIQSFDEWVEWSGYRADFPFRKQRAPRHVQPGLLDHHIAGRILRLVAVLGRDGYDNESIREEITHRMLILHPMCDEQDI